MSFKPEKVDEFVAIFSNNWKNIKGFDGCSHVELLRDRENPAIFFTYSLWQSQQHVDAYRESELFARVWGATKLLFNDQPQAWSVEELNFD